MRRVFLLFESACVGDLTGYNFGCIPIAFFFRIFDTVTED